jgi:hypothetical protein
MAVSVEIHHTGSDPGERAEIAAQIEHTLADLKELNEQLEITMAPGISERDPEYVKFLRQRYGSNEG